MLHWKPLALFGGLVLVAIALCGIYIFLADRYCPADAGAWAQSIGEHEAHEINNWTGAAQHSADEAQEIAARPQTKAAKNESRDQADDKGSKAHRWAVKFACEAKLADVALVFFTTCLVIATLWLGWATIGLWKTTETAIALASSEYTSTHRPRISIRRVRLVDPSEGAPIQISYRVVNSGETAANILQMNGTVVILNSPSDLPPVPEYDTSRTTHFAPRPGDGLQSGQWLECIATTAWAVDKSTLDNIPYNFVAVIGYVRYSDDSGIVREMAFGRCRTQGRFSRSESEEYEYQD